ncbi:MAG: AEC family transporter, partial [Rhodospirillales bacterium]|nr:AEC family transporter [Rhodospirillales bacterium]
ERATYFIFFPALLINSTSNANLAGIDFLPIAASLLLPILLVTLLALAIRPVLAADGPSFTSIIQGNIRPNTYVGIAGAFALFGDHGLTLTALAIVCYIPTVNVIAVMGLLRYAPIAGKGIGWREVISAIGSNPLILAPLIGLALNGSGVGSPPLIGPLLEVLGRAALPVGLMAVGAGLDISALRPVGRFIVLTTATKLAVMPALTFGMCLALGLDAVATGVCVLYAALPCSASSYVLARQMGGNAELMAGIITATTLVAMVSIPAAMWFVA